VAQKVSNERWGKAQAYERGFWSVQAGRSAGQSSRFQWYKERAERIWSQAKPLLDGETKISVLEIGPGPVGLVNYIEADERHALDPLENYYRSQVDFVKIRSKGVSYHQGTGEDISGLNRTFSFVIIDNVLDHVKDPRQVIREIHKNLKSRGIMFVSLNIYTQFGAWIRNLMEVAEIDRGHPFNFTQDSIMSTLQGCGFETLFSETEDYRTQKRKYRKSGQMREILKSYLGVTDFRFSAFCRKA
jgi:2-polyprenyl-3-methyl-5-hydroxy-6-metoxy-1,4-benzoquinol methylase